MAVFLICVALGVVLEANCESEFWLKHVGVHHHVRSLSVPVGEWDDFVRDIKVAFITAMKPAMNLLQVSIVGLKLAR